MASDDSSRGGGAGSDGHVFISHHSSQYEAARRVKAALAEAGIRGWLAPDDVDPGSAFDMQILAAMKDARAVVLLLCAQSDASRHVKREVMLADDADKPVFPVRLEKVKAEGLAYWLKDHQWIDWFGGKGDGLGRLVDAVREALALPPGPSQASTTAEVSKRAKRGLLIGGGVLTVAAASVAGYLLVPGAAGPAPYFKPGLWLNKREMIAVTYPQVTAEAAQQIKQTMEDDPNPEECMLAAVSRNPDVKLFDPGNKGKCVLSSFQIGGGRMSGYLNCPMQGIRDANMLIAFRGSYTATSIDVDQDVTMSQPGGTLKFKARENSHWVADKCPADNR